MKKLMLFALALVWACSPDLDNIKPDLPEFQNHSFDAPTINPWQEVLHKGQPWLYGGRYCECLQALGEGNSTLIQQSGFKAGKYTLEFVVINDNPLADITNNGLLRIFYSDHLGTHESDAFIYLDHGFNRKQITFNLPYDGSIGFKVFRVGRSGGRSGNLNISVNQVSIAKYSLR